MTLPAGNLACPACRTLVETMDLGRGDRLTCLCGAHLVVRADAAGQVEIALAAEDHAAIYEEAIESNAFLRAEVERRVTAATGRGRAKRRR